MVADSHDYGEKDAYGSKKPEGRCGMSMADTIDGDGRVSREEHARHADKMFDMMDKNKDGYIDKDEAAAMRKKHAKVTTVTVRLIARVTLRGWTSSKCST